MGLIGKLSTALRGRARETLEQAVDSNGLRIFEQEISDCEQSIFAARQDLTRLIAERIRLQREADSLASSIDEKEQLAAEALRQQREAEARTLADWIGTAECSLEDLRKKQKQLEAHEQQLKAMLQQAVQQLECYRREFRMARATDNARSAGFRLSQRPADLCNQFSELKSSLERIQARQQNSADRLKASEIIDSVLSEAAIPRAGKPRRNDRTEAILQRLRRETGNRNDQQDTES